MYKSSTIRLDFQVLLYREGDFWIAHCLETDLAAEAADPTLAVEALVDVSNVQIEQLLAEGNLDGLFSPAPPELWRMYAVAKDTRTPKLSNAAKSVNRMSVRKLVTA